MNVDLSPAELSYLIHLMYFDRKMCLVDDADMCEYGYNALLVKLDAAHRIDTLKKSGEWCDEET